MSGPLVHPKRRSWVSHAAIRKPCCSTGEHLMRHVDFSPLYRSTVGFDRLFTMLDSLAQPDGAQTYPPYNIERTGEDSYRISMAVAGFSDEEISIEAHRNVLTVKGERKDEGTGEGSELLYRGIASQGLRAPLPACRPCRSRRRRAEERPALRRPQAQHSRRAEAAQDRDHGGFGQGQADRGQDRRLVSVLTHSKRKTASRFSRNCFKVSSRDGSGAERRRFFVAGDTDIIRRSAGQSGRPHRPSWRSW